MSVNIDFYGHSIDVDPEVIADELEPSASRGDIERAVNEYIASALEDEPMPSYRHDGDDVVDRVMELLEERREEEDDA